MRSGEEPWGRGSSRATLVPAPSPCPPSRSFVAGVIHPWRVSAFERLLWRACRGYLVASFVEMPEPMEDPDTVRGAAGWAWGGGGQGPPPHPGGHPPSLQRQEPSRGEQARACWQEQRPEQFTPKVSGGHREEQCSSWEGGV